MAAITPSSVVVDNVGSSKKMTATFANVDDNDTWASGIQGIIDWDFHCSIDGPNDTTVDLLTRATGTFRFGSAAAQTGRLSVWFKS